ncbi:MAG TPA: VanW family protein [Candidatus Limnocylindrales bacterium]|nr:VanW family protein [Candidatus Limnocylindrales bacterium]
MDLVNESPAESIQAPTASVEAGTPAPASGDGAASGTAASAAASRARRLGIRRFAAAFFFGVMGVLAVSAGALAAFESSNNGRILPGIHVGAVDLSGLTPAEARARLNEAYAALAVGELTLTAGGTTRVVTYATLGRRLDVDAVVDQAMGIGRTGATLERIASNVRNMVRGVELAPSATFERPALRLELDRLAASVAIAPVDATVALVGEDFAVAEGADGRSADVAAALADATALLVDVAAPDATRVTVPLDVVEPAVTTVEATAAREAALRIAVDTVLVDGAESWTIAGATIRSWISFAPTADGGYGPVVAQAGLEAGLAAIAGDVAVAPVDASFLVGDGDSVVGVTEAKNGRALDVPGMVTALTKTIDQRVSGLTISRVSIRTIVVEPALTTEEATQTAPLMEPIAEWTTWFPIGIKNGQGANIWIPARDVDGYVVMPGQWFDFWEAIGPVTRERGYKDGGAIINGKTEPQGALAGGICSTSTTLFNAALRAGLEMGARRNHYYYIDRYPLGLDATVFQSSSGSVQTMSFRNDTESPILIRGSGWSVGSKGYVKFVLWSVPTERTVSFSTPIVKNVKPATDSVVYTTALAPGARERIEYPVDGKDVWVTRTVKDAAGTVLHEETYYSHYARITGIVRVGIAPTPDPTPEPTPTPPVP